MPWRARRPKMCSIMGVSTTGAMGLGISPVSGKSLVPLPAASAIAFIRGSLPTFGVAWTRSLPFSALVQTRLLVERLFQVFYARHLRQVEEIPDHVVDLH